MIRYHTWLAWMISTWCTDLAHAKCFRLTPPPVPVTFWQCQVFKIVATLQALLCICIQQTLWSVQTQVMWSWCMLLGNWGMPLSLNILVLSVWLQPLRCSSWHTHMIHLYTLWKWVLWHLIWYIYNTLWKMVRGSFLPVPWEQRDDVFPEVKNALRFMLSLTLSTTIGMKVDPVAPRSSTLKTAFWLCLYSSANRSVMWTVLVLIWAK